MGVSEKRPTMRMKVICGDLECREEFFVESKEAVWVCPKCSREIINKNYPFLTAKLMQAKIDGELTDWKKRLSEILDEARKEIEERRRDRDMDLAFIDEAVSALSSDLSNEEYRRIHDEVLEKARQVVLSLDG